MVRNLSLGDRLHQAMEAKHCQGFGDAPEPPYTSF